MSIWSGLFFVLCSVLTPALCCDWVNHFGHQNGKSLDLIESMGDLSTKQESPVPFPDKLYRHISKEKVESQLVFIRDNLIMIADLYHHNNRTTVTWSNNTTESFLMSIEKQINELNLCVPIKRQVNLTSVICRNNTSKDSGEKVQGQTEELHSCASLQKGVEHKLRHYYRRLVRCSLDHTGGSAASWELIRQETKNHLIQLDVLMNAIKNSGLASRGRSTLLQ